MDLGLKGKNAVVTGGASGIGKAIALELVREGARVFVTSRDEKKLEDILSSLNKVSSGHGGLVTDLVSPGEIDALYEAAISLFGQVDIVVNNAGTTQGITDPYCAIEDWRKVFRLNLEVPIEINNKFLPGMKARDWGRIVNISAGAALENSGPVTYSSSKAAMSAYTRSMGRILAIENNDVVMSAVLPGVIITEDGHWGGKYKEDSEHAQKYLKDRCPIGRFGQPEEVACQVVLQCSVRASFFHGSNVLVDAGQAKHYMYSNYLD